MVKNYPRKGSIRRVIREHLTAQDTKRFLKQRGIIVHARKKEDIAKIGGDYYFNQNDYSDLKNLMDSDHNYRKTGRFTFPKNIKQSLEETLVSLNNTTLDREDNTRLTVTKNKAGDLKVLLNYDEYKPSLIDLLDRTARQVEISINSHKDDCSLDFNMETTHDYKKVKELLDYVTSFSRDIKFNFNQISLDRLPKLQRIELFERFSKSLKSPWKLREINKLKVKRDTEESKVSQDQLQGINSALLDGTNLRENSFVKETLNKGFYFSMVSMRIDKEKSVNFIDLVIDFKARPEMCEVKISNSGIYVHSVENNEIKEIKKVMDRNEQDQLLYEYKNNLSDIYAELLDTPLPEIEITHNESAATIDEGETNIDS